MSSIVRLILVLSFVLTIPFGAKAAADTDFKIRAGDVLQVTVWKEDGMDRELVVLPDGTINFPLIGAVLVQDKTPMQAQEFIKEQLKRSIPEASVTVMVKAPLGHTISVLGQVAKPGDIVMGRKMNVMQALSQAGGLTPYARENKIVVLRNVNGEKKSFEFPYDDVAGGDFEKDLDLMPGDVVFVPTSGLF